MEAAIARANPEAASEKERKAQEATFSKALRTEAHGMGSYLTRAPIWIIRQIAATMMMT